MRSGPALNLFLAVVVVLMAAWLVAGQSAKQPPATISDINPDSISGVWLTRPGKPDIALQRSGNDWRIVSPINTIASPFRINSLLSLLQARSISTVSASPEQLGFPDEKNAVTLIFDRYRFRFGPINPLDRSRYVEYSGTVHLIDDTLYPQLLQDAGFFAETIAGDKQEN